MVEHNIRNGTSEAESYARSLIEVSRNPLVSIDPQGRITDANAATVEAVGIPRDQLIGSDFADCFSEPEKARAAYQRVLEEGLLSDYPLALRHVSGALTDVEYNAAVYRDAGGELRAVFAAARDPAEAQEARLQVARLALVAASSHDATFSRDLEGTITSWNAAAESALRLRGRGGDRTRRDDPDAAGTRGRDAGAHQAHAAGPARLRFRDAAPAQGRQPARRGAHDSPRSATPRARSRRSRSSLTTSASRCAPSASCASPRRSSPPPSTPPRTSWPSRGSATAAPRGQRGFHAPARLHARRGHRQDDLGARDLGRPQATRRLRRQPGGVRRDRRASRPRCDARTAP